jgi:hypothetical protein
MKTKLFPRLLGLAWLMSAVTFFSCSQEQDLASGQLADGRLEARANQNSILYPPTAHPYGKSYAEWAEDFWIRLMAFDCETIFSEEVYALNQDYPIFFLSGSVSTYEYDVTIPRNKPVMTPIINYINDWPCPDPDFGPAPGQSLEDFLQEGAQDAIDIVDNIHVTFDGQELTGMEDYRFLSDLFYFTGHPSLTDCMDPCVTGESQAAVTDGYYLIFKKMSPGQHTLRLQADLGPYGSLDGTFNITVE